MDNEVVVREGSGVKRGSLVFLIVSLGYSLNFVLPQIYIEALNLVSQKMTILGDKGLKDIIKLKLDY